MIVVQVVVYGGGPGPGVHVLPEKWDQVIDISTVSLVQIFFFFIRTLVFHKIKNGLFCRMHLKALEDEILILFLILSDKIEVRHLQHIGDTSVFSHCLLLSYLC